MSYARLTTEELLARKQELEKMAHALGTTGGRMKPEQQVEYEAILSELRRRKPR